MAPNAEWVKVKVPCILCASRRCAGYGVLKCMESGLEVAPFHSCGKWVRMRSVYDLAMAGPGLMELAF